MKDGPLGSASAPTVQFSSSWGVLAMVLVAFCAARSYTTASENSEAKMDKGVAPPSKRELAERSESAQRRQDLLSGKLGEQVTQVADFPPINDPKMLTAKTCELPDSTPIIGVKFKGVAKAFVLKELASPKQHIVNFWLGKQPVSITHCDLDRCTRVFTWDQQKLIPLNTAGLSKNLKMVMLLENHAYLQRETNLPLNELSFREMTWGQWKAENPQSQVFVGTSKS